MSKPILIIATSSGCGHCMAFKQNFEKGVLDMLKETNYVELIQVHDGRIQQKVHFNPTVGKYLTKVPAFALITRESWDSNGEPELVMMNLIPGRVTPDGFIKTEVGERKYPVNSNGVKEWLETNLKTNPMFNKNVPRSTSSIVDSPFMLVPLKKKVETPVTSMTGIRYRKYDSDSDSD